MVAHSCKNIKKLLSHTLQIDELFDMWILSPESCFLKSKKEGRHIKRWKLGGEEEEKARQREWHLQIDKAVEVWKAGLFSPLDGHSTSFQIQPRVFNGPMAQKRNTSKMKFSGFVGPQYCQTRPLMWRHETPLKLVLVLYKNS